MRWPAHSIFGCGLLLAALEHDERLRDAATVFREVMEARDQAGNVASHEREVCSECRIAFIGDVGCHGSRVVCRAAKQA